MYFFIYLSFFLLFLYCLLLIYYLYGWLSLPLFKAEPKINSEVFISVIVTARNEEIFLPTLLQGLKDQTYPSTFYEVIIVDDHSTDRTHDIASKFSMPHLKLISLKDFVEPGLNSYKKKAIEVAISQAKGELIVTTDADCVIPCGWLHNIASFYDKSKAAFIVMPVSIDCGMYFLEMFQSLDFMTLQGITGASVHEKFHSMCNGANLSYTKEAFIKAGGFEGINNIASGDDMLLMHKINKLYPHQVRYLKSKEVIVFTHPTHTIKDFINQRIRWASKADKYEDMRIVCVLILVYSINVILLLMPVVALINNKGIHVFSSGISLIGCWAILLFAKTFVELCLLLPVADFFSKKSLLLFFPVFQPFHIFYTCVAGWLGKFGSYEWKGRKVK